MLDRILEMPENTIPVATAINEGYVLPLLVMLQSLREHLRPGWHVDLYLLHRSLSAPSLEKISSYVRVYSTLVEEEGLSAIGSNAKFPAEAAFPLLVPSSLPSGLQRVLFLDADVLVLDDLALLWEQDLKGLSTGAVVDTAIPRCGSPRGVKRRDLFGVPAEAPYFNAGLLLMDLVAWREKSIAAKALEYLRVVGQQADFLHQEALNAAIWDDWAVLPRRWNLPGALAGRRIDPGGVLPPGTHGIVHFAGRFKPWRCRLGGQFSSAYEHYLQCVLAAQPSLGVFARSTAEDRFLGWYNRNLRDYFFGLERTLWKNRWI